MLDEFSLLKQKLHLCINGISQLCAGGLEAKELAGARAIASSRLTPKFALTTASRAARISECGSISGFLRVGERAFERSLITGSVLLAVL